MTPSGWHDDACNRDAGHDDMQIAVFDYLRDTIFFKPDGFERRLQVSFEHPFVRRGRVISWGDVVEVWEKADYQSFRHYVVWEIKPAIYSVGAVVRQCQAIRVAASSVLMRRDGHSHDVTVIPVIKADDPKFNALRHVFHAVSWDGSAMT